MSAHDCAHHGHVWLETDGTPYSRHRGRSQVDVSVICAHCLATASLPAFAAYTAPPQEALESLRLKFKALIEEALRRDRVRFDANVVKSYPTDGPVPKSP